MAFLKSGPELSFLWRKCSEIKAFLFPRYCFTCGEILQPEDLLLCPECLPTIRRNPEPCPICARPLQENSPCLSCFRKRPTFTRTIAPFLYSPPLSRALCELKYQKKIHLVREIGDLWQRYFQGDLGQDLLVCPVPLHRKRLRERGFNQSSLLARRIFGKNRVRELLFRKRATSPQASLSLNERFKNVKGAFEARETGPIKGKKILLFDDILTTGATVEECARALLAAGAKEVWVAVVARAE